MVKPGSRLDWCRVIYGELRACEKWGSAEKRSDFYVWMFAGEKGPGRQHGDGREEDSEVGCS